MDNVWDQIKKVHQKTERVAGNGKAIAIQIACLIEEMAETMEAINALIPPTITGQHVFPGAEILRATRDHMFTGVMSAADMKIGPMPALGGYILKERLNKVFNGQLGVGSEYGNLLKELSDVIWCAYAVMELLGVNGDDIARIVAENNWSKVKDGVRIDPQTGKYLKPSGYTKPEGAIFKVFLDSLHNLTSAADAVSGETPQQASE